MKNVNLKRKLALLISACAMAVAAASSSMCAFAVFSECKMPKSLYKVD